MYLYKIAKPTSLEVTWAEVAFYDSMSQFLTPKDKYPLNKGIDPKQMRTTI